MDSGPAGPPSPEPTTQNPKPTQSSEPNQINPNDKLRVKFSDQGLNHDRESCSSSTTSDASDDGDDDDDDDFFHIDPTEFGRPVPFNPTEPTRSPLTPPGEKPPVHPAGRSYDVPDPNRIPLEIFNRTKSTSPMDWSVASNESLFSIHMGNSSFSRESAFVAGLSHYSGSPSPMDGGGLTSQPLSPAPPLLPPLYPGTPPTTTTMPAPPVVSRKPMDMEIGEGPEEPDVAEAMMNNVVTAAAVIEYESEETEKSAPDWMNNSANMSRRSDSSSVASFQSFAFPILTGGETRTSSSIKVEPEHQRMQHHQQQQQQQQSPKAAPEAAPAPPAAATLGPGNKGWFPSFSSCGSCCS